MGPPSPAGPAWTHLILGGDDNGALNAFQLPARADGALFSRNGVSERTPWQCFGGNRRRSSVLEDLDQGPVVSVAGVLAKGSVYCFPNPTRGQDIGLAYTLGAGVSSVEIRVLDPMGHEVGRLSGPAGPAQNVVRIPVNALASGVYLVRIQATAFGASAMNAPSAMNAVFNAEKPLASSPAWWASWAWTSGASLASAAARFVMVTPFCGVGCVESAGAKWPVTKTRREPVQPGKAKGASCCAVTLVSTPAAGLKASFAMGATLQ